MCDNVSASRLLRTATTFVVIACLCAQGVASAASMAGVAGGLSALRSLKGQPIFVRAVNLGEFRCELIDATDTELVVRRNGASIALRAGDIDLVSVQRRKTREGALTGAVLGAGLALVASRLDGCVAKGCGGVGMVSVVGLGALIGAWVGSREPKIVVVYRR